MSDIEERLAKLRGSPVKNIRYPRVLLAIHHSSVKSSNSVSGFELLPFRLIKLWSKKVAFTFVFSVAMLVNFQFAVLNGNEVEEETVEKLIKRARDEAMLETKWDCSEKSEDEHGVDPEEFIKMCGSDPSLPDGMLICNC